MKKEMEPGPLIEAVSESRNSIARLHALRQYRDNLDAARPYARAWGRGGLLFGILGGFFTGLAIAGVWVIVPGGPVAGFVGIALNLLSIVLNRRSVQVNRRAIAGWPVSPP